MSRDEAGRESGGNIFWSKRLSEVDGQHLHTQGGPRSPGRISDFGAYFWASNPVDDLLFWGLITNSEAGLDPVAGHPGSGP